MYAAPDKASVGGNKECRPCPGGVTRRTMKRKEDHRNENGFAVAVESAPIMCFGRDTKAGQGVGKLHS